jgi:hypothetical protein
MIVNSIRAFFGLVESRDKQTLILGPSSSSLLATFEGALDDESRESRKRVLLTALEIHALYVLLIWLPISFTSEEAFVDRVGAYRENLHQVAEGLLSAVAAANMV